MVFFNCGECGESMRKAQVEKHYKFKCRNCQCLSCVDCGKEFWGDDYQKHTKCISEGEKYGGKDYKPKPNANKGERKQEEWTDQVQSAIDKCKDPKLKTHLEKMKSYSNIPRKKAKFENFIKNSLRVPAFLATKLWDVISAENPANKQPEPAQSLNGQADKEPEAVEEKHQNGDAKVLNKRERKEERQKLKAKKQKKDKTCTDTLTDESCEKEARKKKRKHEEEEDMKTAETENEDPSPKKKKKKHLVMVEDESLEETKQKSGKKKKLKEQTNDSSLNEESQSQESEAEAEVVTKTKFSMENMIVQILTKAEDKELKLKKLKKKVLAEYHSCHPDGHLSEEKISAKFDKKLKNPRYKVHKDRVKLVK